MIHTLKIRDYTRPMLFVSSLALCTALTPVVAFAQDAGAVPSTSGTNGGGQQLQEIVVTAQRREQNLQDTPISISAFNAQALQANGVTSVKELGQIVSSLNLSGNEGVVYPVLRGIGNLNGGNAGNESSVAVYLDDVYYSRLSPAYLALGSIDRVEVLNGPQGTLFGRNSSGGALQLFTKDPGRTPEMDVTAGYANYNTVSGNLYASTPVTDTLSWNFAVGGSSQGQGWGKSVVTGKDAYKESEVTVRSKLLWEPSDRTRVKFVAYYALTDGSIGNAVGTAKGTFASGPNWAFLGKAPPPGYPSAQGLYPSLSNNSSTFYDTRENFPSDVHEHGYGGSIRIDQDVSFADLVSISAARKSSGYALADDDYTANNFLNANLHSIDNDISEELQIKSKRGSKISWIVGGYYFYTKAGFKPASIYGDFLDYAIAPGSAENIFGLQTINSYAGFGQVTAPIFDKTNLTLGARYTEDHLQGKGTQTIVIPGVGDIPASAPYADAKHAHAFTYKAAIDHHFADDFMTYASVSRGYKAGTFNTIPLDQPPNKAETVMAYELGVKSEFFDRRVRVNGALFWNEIKNPQVLEIVTQGNVSGTALINAQKARTRGGEVAIEAVPVTGLTLHTGVTYVDARYLKFLNAPFYQVVGGALTGPTAGDASGNRMPDVPKWKVDLGATYTLNSSAGEWVGDVSVSYSSKLDWSADNLIPQKPVTLLNVSLNYTPASQKWLTFSAWGKNLTKSHYFSFVQEQVGQLGNSEFQGMPGAPLTFGGSISMKFR